MDKLEICKETEVYVKVNKNAFRMNEMSKAWLVLTYLYIDISGTVQIMLDVLQCGVECGVRRCHVPRSLQGTHG